MLVSGDRPDHARDGCRDHRAGGRHLATHRTYLEQDKSGRWIKARLKHPKMVLGSFVGGVIPLQRGASGKPLRQASEGEETALGEGIENCLSAALAAPELRVMAGISVGNLARISLPPAISRILLLADNDPPGTPAALALQRAVDRFLAEGRRIRVARPPHGFKDLNDLAQSDEMETA
ncbi:toprim domain-containing protein [Teichococcus aestuarii]|uniref:toprim domain-containing protein n=1 Tax=Teichococcus aestuarii TaxID=568898 RepID=UPI0036065854